MYPSLGKFNVSITDPDWPASMTYTAEPPVTVKHSMNPWQTEREREVWLAEEKSWKGILPKQAKYREWVHKIKVLISQLNGQVSELERTTGQKSGMGIATYGTMLYSLAGGPYAWVAAIAKMGVDMIIGISTKKRAKKIQARIEAMIAQITQAYAANEVIKGEIEGLIRVAEGIRATQPARAKAAVDQSEGFYLKRLELDRTRATVLQERNRQAAFLPRRPTGGDYATI